MNIPCTSFGLLDPHEPLAGFALLMRKALEGNDLGSLAQQLIDRMSRDPTDANAMLDLSTILQLRFQPELGLAAQGQALQMRQLYRLGRPADLAKIRLLAIMAPGDMMTNTPLDCLLEGADITLYMLYVIPGLALPDLLPQHDVVMIAVGEPDRNHEVLQQIMSFVKHTSRPVLNAPERALLLTRDGACQLLGNAPGVVMPVTTRIKRDTLHRIAESSLAIANVLVDGAFPLIVRPVGSHAGRALAKIDRASDITDYLQGAIETDFYISRFVDYRGPDDLYRKYRIVLIDGVPYACHMGISQHWMIHYLNAGMANSTEKRAEEELFMATFDNDFAIRHRQAFTTIYEKMGLSYLGIDCAETRSGKLLIFEVDTGMIVHAMDSVDVFPYKLPQMRKVFRAFYAMLTKAAEQVSHSPACLPWSKWHQSPCDCPVPGSPDT